MAANPSPVAHKEITKELTEIGHGLDRLESIITRVEEEFQVVLSKVPGGEKINALICSVSTCALGDILSSFRIRLNTQASRLEEIISRSQL